MSEPAAAAESFAVTLPDGSVRRYTHAITPAEIALEIGPGLAKAALAAKVDGAERDLSYSISSDVALEIITAKSPEALELLRHDAAHVMAEAVKELYPETQVTIGPAIENGFYYDFARDEPFSPEDLEKIEARMREIVDRDETIIREEWDRNVAIKYFEDLGEVYKAEIIRDLPEDEVISIYRQGDFLDLCVGPHLPSTAKLGKAFKLMKLAGAYWRGDHRNAMLQRIYGTAWRDEKELKAYLTQLEEAEKRDHRRLGREMDLFHFQEEAQGSVFWHDKGYVIWQALEQYIRRRIRAAGYQEVKTPQILASKFWEQSGHWSKFRENMFIVPDEIPSIEEDKPVLTGDAELMALKPMNCPAHIQIFKQGIKSYRDLPIRMAEFGCCHRNEPHGALHGLMRVRQMTQDDIAAAPTTFGIGGTWLGGWRAASAMVAPKLWDRFAWPYYVKIAEALIAKGITPVLHWDQDWTRDLVRLQELPAKKCILNPDGMTDLKKFKELVGDRMAMMGDIPASLLAAGTPDDVHKYVRELVELFEGTGLLLCPGCDAPINAKPENMEAIVEAAHKYGAM